MVRLLVHGEVINGELERRRRQLLRVAGDRRLRLCDGRLRPGGFLEHSQQGVSVLVGSASGARRRAGVAGTRHVWCALVRGILAVGRRWR